MTFSKYFIIHDSGSKNTQISNRGQKMKHVIREEKLRPLTYHWMLAEGILK